MLLQETTILHQIKTPKTLQCKFYFWRDFVAPFSEMHVFHFVTLFVLHIIQQEEGVDFVEWKGVEGLFKTRLPVDSK